MTYQRIPTFNSHTEQHEGSAEYQLTSSKTNLVTNHFYPEMSKISLPRIVPYQGTLLGNPIHMSIEVELMFKATIVFTLFGMPYSFVISSWQGRGFRKFIEHFYCVAMTRNAIKFGVMIEKDDGTKDFLRNLDDITLLWILTTYRIVVHT